jgi:acyl-CoA reductase-like NAD-dependent aldehyde dehydrogenase
MVFGDVGSTRAWEKDPRVEVHGPGYSKVVLGRDAAADWKQYLDVMASSIAENGGRSCINASAVVVPRHGEAIAEALAQRLGPIGPVAADHPEARLSGFANPKMAEAMDAAIEQGLATTGAVDMTARHRQGPRRVVFEGGTFLRPTIVWCDSFSHPLANREFLFPYASVVEAPQDRMLDLIGPSLVVTAITKDPAFQRRLLESPLIDRLNLGPVSTMQVSWDQPHEGNLFEFLYRRRSIEWGEGYRDPGL